jgi:hypothetical protein
MKTFDILLAHDTTFYGNVHVEAETWEEAVASLTEESWTSACEVNDGLSFSQRVVHVEDEDGEIVAEDLGWDDCYIHTFVLKSRIDRIVREHHTGEGTAAMVEALEAMLAGFEEDRRHPLLHPLFQKGEEA